MADTAEIAFDLCGAGLRVAAPRRSWVELFVKLLGRFETSSARSKTFHLVIGEDDDPKIPPGVPMTWEGEFIEKRPGRIYETDAIEVIEVVGHGFVAVDHSTGRAEAVMKSGSEDAFSFTPMMNVLDASLKAGGMNMLHAACLVVPDGSGAIAICAPSGFGKTTTSLALAHGGFGLVTDDASIIELHASGLAIWGLPRKLKVHRRTAAMMPWIGTLPDTWNGEDEQAVAVESLADQITTAEPVPVPLKAVVLLGPRSNGDHKVTHLSKAEALVRIAQDNVSNSVTGVKVWNRRHFEAFAVMLRSAPVLQLNAGTAVETLPTTLDAALQRFGAG